MIINDHINVQDDRLMNGLSPMINIMSKIESSEDEKFIIDFSNTKFISPVFILSLMIYVMKTQTDIHYINLNDYMKALRNHFG